MTADIGLDVVTLARDWFVDLFHSVDCGCAGEHDEQVWQDYRALADTIMQRVETGTAVVDTDAGRHAAVQVWLPLLLPFRSPAGSPRIRDCVPTDGQEAT